MGRPAKNAATINTETKKTVAEVEETTATVETVEEVKVAEDVKDPEEMESVEKTEIKNGLPFTVKDGKVLCVSEKRAGKTIFAITGTAITFGADGSATVSVEDAMYLSKCPGFNFK